MARSLVLLNGASRGAAVPLNEAGPPVTIGRDASRELPVDDPLCSRLHARVWFDGRDWQLEDCASRNGTRLNGEPIQRSILEPGDLIRVGDCVVVLAESDGKPKPTGIRPAELAVSTLVKRVAAPHEHPTSMDTIEDVPARPELRSVREARLLCRLAVQLTEAENPARVAQLAVVALVDGIGAEPARIWLVGIDGRLRPAASSDSGSELIADTSVLAGLSLEQDEAVLLRCGGQGATDSDADAARRGNAICVPIPGRGARRGALECHRDASSSGFAQEDLEYAIAVAHQLGMALENVEHRERLEQANQQLRETVSDRTQLIGDSPAVQSLRETVHRVAATRSTVLIIGESGTGKELVARLCHEYSPRRDGPYVAVNCAAFTETLLDSELFGHERGAFTGAERRRLGQFERAHLGTIFLDEVGELSLACQAKLLRVLEGHPFERLGGIDAVHVDVRLLAATHRDLAALVAQGRFREDLFYRLRVIELAVPPLRERGDDALVLAAHFLERFRRETGRGPRRLAEGAAQSILCYPWPGNVRELKNAIERAVVLGAGEAVMPEELGLAAAGSLADPANRMISLAEAEQLHIRYVLKQAGGNKTRACKILGIGRGTLYKKLSELPA